MSIQHTAAVWAHSRAEHSARLVLLALADHMNQATGLAWPSVETLCAVTRLSERAVRGAIGVLLELGELVEAESTVSGQRAFALALECPAECDGTTQHRMPTERARKAMQDARGALGTARAAETAREAPGAPLKPVETPAAASEARPVVSRGALSAPEAAVHRGMVSLEGMFSSVFDEVLEVEAADSAGVHADSAGPSMQILPPHAREPYWEPREGTTNQPGRGSSRPDSAPVQASTTAQSADVGGGDDSRMWAQAVTGVLPSPLRRQVSPGPFLAAVREALERGLAGEAIVESVRGRSWNGTGPGAVIAHLRALDPVVNSTPTPSAGRERRWCPEHPSVEITRRRCATCREAEIARGQNAPSRRRDGESVEQWTRRVAGDS